MIRCIAPAPAAVKVGMCVTLCVCVCVCVLALPQSSRRTIRIHMTHCQAHNNVHMHTHMFSFVFCCLVRVLLHVHEAACMAQLSMKEAAVLVASIHHEAMAIFPEIINRRCRHRSATRWTNQNRKWTSQNGYGHAHMHTCMQEYTQIRTKQHGVRSL